MNHKGHVIIFVIRREEKCEFELFQPISFLQFRTSIQMNSNVMFMHKRQDKMFCGLGKDMRKE